MRACSDEVGLISGRASVMSDDTLIEFERAYRGCACTIQKRDYDWVFSFSDKGYINVASPWRIIQNGRIAYAGHACDLLEGRLVECIELDRATADIHLHFDDQTRIDIFNGESGYEGWQAGFRIGGEGVLLVGLGGGDVAIFRGAEPMENT